MLRYRVRLTELDSYKQKYLNVIHLCKLSELVVKPDLQEFKVSLSIQYYVSYQNLHYTKYYIK